MMKGITLVSFFILPLFSFSQATKSLDEKNKTLVSDSTQVPDTLVHTNVDIENTSNISYSDDDARQPHTEAVSSVLSNSRDAFSSAAAYSFSAARYRIRGYGDEDFLLLINGAPLSDLSNGRSLYSSWSGLNDMFRNRTISFGLSPVDYSYGAIGGTYSIDAGASQQRKQLSVSYDLTDRTYNNRLMVSYGSGPLKGGWSYAVSFSRRWADEGYIQGTYFDSYSYFGSLEKTIGSNHSLSLTAFGSPTISGLTSPSTQEMLDLAGSHYYNPNWGYQDGQMRNAVVSNNNIPVIILRDEWKINSKSSLESAASYSFGKDKVSGFDWYNAVDPMPDYYRKLPSYDPFDGKDPASYSQLAAQETALLKNNESLRQVDWDGIYAANALHDTTFNGTTGKWAKYILQNRVSDHKNYAFNTFYNNTLSDHVKISSGFTYQMQETEYYKEVSDLLGADFYVDLNQFADQTNTTNPNAIQNNLLNPNRILHVGDKYGYDYTSHITNYGLWAQSVFNYNAFDYMLAAKLSGTSMYRSSLVQNGIFPDNSLGDSPTESFTNYDIKGGALYKYNRSNDFYVNTTYLTQAPTFDNIFISPQTRNSVVTDPVSQTVTSAEGGYVLKSPSLSGRLVGYITQFNNGTETRSFYDDDYNTFVNYTLTGVDKRHEGIEASAEKNLGKGFSVLAVASVGQYYYNSRPSATITQDNKDTILAQNQTVYWDNIRVAGSPQQAYSLGAKYRSRHYWSVNASVNFFNGIYYDANPSRRTISGLDLVDAGTAQWQEILGQQEAPSAVTADISGGWSWKINRKFNSIKRSSYLVLSCGITNLTNNTNVVNTAYEQLRFDTEDHNINEFPPKLSYAYGRTYFVSISVRMD